MRISDWSSDVCSSDLTSHTLVAKAYDAAGNVGTSASVSFSVNNTTITQSVDNSQIVADMKARLDSMDATLATMSTRNGKVKSLKADVATQRDLVSRIK